MWVEANTKLAQLHWRVRHFDMPYEERIRDTKYNKLVGECDTLAGQLTDIETVIKLWE